MKKLLSIILSAIMLLSLTSCTKADAAWQEQFDRGVRYLNNLEYESAIQSFNEAIKIDPKKENAYIALAGTYYEQGDTAKALETIDTAISTAGSSENLEETKQQIENNSFSTNETVTDLVIDNATVKTERVDNEDGSYTEKAIDKDKKIIKETVYYGEYCTVIIPEYNEKGIKIREYLYYPGSTDDYIVNEYDERGNLVKEIGYNADGSIWYWDEYQYDKDNNCISMTPYGPDGTVIGERKEYRYDNKGALISQAICWQNGRKDIYEYDENGNTVKETRVDSNGYIKYVFEYDASGRKTMEYNYYDGELYGMVEYDENERAVRVIECDAQGNPYGWYAYEYDASGNRTNTSYYYGDGTKAW